MALSRDAIRASILKGAFGGPLLQNNLRGVWVEHMLALTLAPDWELCSGDWAGWDLAHCSTGTRAQVRQSAARQTWVSRTPYSGAFSIAAATGYWREGTHWIAETGRHAEVFIFGWHPIEDETADHTDPESWCFYVVGESELPRQKTISRRRIAQFAPEFRIDEIADGLRAFLA